MKRPRDGAVEDGSSALVALASRCCAADGAPGAAELFAHLAAALCEAAPRDEYLDAALRSSLVAVARAGAAVRRKAGRNRAALALLDGAFLRCRDGAARRALAAEADALHDAALRERSFAAARLDAWPDAAVLPPAAPGGFPAVPRSGGRGGEIDLAVPRVLERAIASWPALAAWASPRRLVAAAGARSVPLEVGTDHRDARGRRQQRVEALGAYVDGVLVPVASGLPPTLGDAFAPVAVSPVVPATSARTRAYLAQHALLEQCPRLAADAPWEATPLIAAAVDRGARAKRGLPPIVSAWVAARGASTPLHFDRHPNVLAHVVGHKRVLLWPPDADVPRHDAPSDNLSTLDCAGGAPPPRGGSVADLRPGDVLVIPEGWWHFATSLTTALSVSIWF